MSPLAAAGAHSRSYVLDGVFDHIARGMDLRRPQRDSLAVMHELLKQLPRRLSELDQSEIARRVREARPEWAFPGGYADLTFALATGVGKTRLMGAMMAYLFRAGESANFLLLAPRDAILRKLEAECRESSPKYIFVHRGIVPQPRVCHRNNLLEFDPGRRTQNLIATGPNVFVLSPQLFSVQGRVAQPSEFVGTSILEYLRSCPDLVVFVDESHHLNATDLDRSSRAWPEAIRNLIPTFVFAMTATPRDGANIAHEYGLSRCLRDRLYTKAVRVIIDEKGADLEDEQYDQFTLRYALSRLEEKERALVRLREKRPAFPPVRSVLLVCAQDVRHADEVGRWLVEEAAFGPEEVLVIHSRRKTEADIATLTRIEEADSRVRIVVQVHVLDEGWDVTNVYVIAPLRNVRSYVNARQVMGRGLRLPVGYRLEEPEVDTLDVLAFGQETFQSIYEQAARDFGDPQSERAGVDIVRSSQEPAAAAAEPIVEPEESGRPDTKQWELSVVRPGSVVVPVLDMVPPEPNLDLDWSSAQAGPAEGTAIELGRMTVGRVSGELRLPRETFLDVTSEYVLRDVNVLSVPRHGRTIRRLAEGYLEALDLDRESNLDLDPVFVAREIGEHIRTAYYALLPTYRSTGRTVTIRVRDCIVNVPLSCVGPLDARRIEWNYREHKQVPCAGWERCTHAAAVFDSRPEFDMARRLDRMASVSLWLRNHPRQFELPTVAGFARPDFVVWIDQPTGSLVLFLEVKGEHLWEARSSEAWVKARDAGLWTEEANRILAGAPVDPDPALGFRVSEPVVSSSVQIEFRIVLGGDVEQVKTLEDIRRVDAAKR